MPLDRAQVSVQVAKHLSQVHQTLALSLFPERIRLEASEVILVQLYRSARWLMPALLLSAVSPFTCAGTLPAVPVALRIFPAMAQPQAGKDAGAAAQTPTGENPPAKKHRFTLNVNGIQVGVGSTTKKQTTTTAKPATGAPTATDTAAAPTSTKAETTPPNPQIAVGADEISATPPPQQQGLAVIGGAAVAGTPIWDGDIKKPITFRWTPVVPKPKDLAGYRVSVWQLMQGQTGPQAIKANQPIITKDVDSFGMTQAAWPPDFVIASCKPPNLCSYVWSVQALDKKGRPVGVNGGIVSMAAFRYEPGATATRGTPLIVVDGNQPAAPGITVLYSGTITNSPGDRTARQPAGPQQPNGFTVTSPATLDVNGMVAGGQEQKPQPQSSNLKGAHVTATNTATGVRLATSGQQQKPQPQNSNVTARIKGTVTDPQGAAVPVTATANPQSGGDRTYLGNPNPDFDDVRKPITFGWTPVVPKPQEPVTYRVSVWEILPGQDAERAIKVNQPILTKLVDEPTLALRSDVVTGPCMPPYLCDYVWSVQALNRNGKPIGENHGLSGTASFSYDSRGRTFLERQPSGEGNQTRRKGGYSLGLNISFERVQPASPGIYDRWGEPDLTEKPATGASGTETPGNAKMAITPINPDDVNRSPARTGSGGATASEDVVVVGYGTQRRSANGVIIITTKNAGNGAPAKASTTNPNPNLHQNPGYLPAVGNPAPADAFRGNKPVLDENELHIRKSSGTPPVEYLTVNPATGAKAQGQQGRIDPAIGESRSVTAPESGSVKPQPADNPITAINITLPANPDAVKKDANTANWGTGTSKPSVIEQTPNQKGKAPETFTVTNAGGSTTGALDTSPQKVQQPGQAQDTLWNPVANQNGKAVPHETVTPIQSTPVPIEHDPDGTAAHGTTNGGSTPQAKPAKKKSKISVHVMF
jgi:hypothetical protein